MRVWVDLANSPHVAICDPIVRRLEDEGARVFVTARDHAQTLELARERWPNVEAVGGESPAGLARKGASILSRARTLALFAHDYRPDVAFAHGSYAQVVGARLVGVPAVTMMDYEGQPANHLSFRLSQQVVVPSVFPEEALRRLGVRPRHVRRYQGFKEELYLASFTPDPTVIRSLGLDVKRLLVVMRCGPDGALYQRGRNSRIDALIEAAIAAEAQVVLLPRIREHRVRYSGVTGLTVPEHPVDGRSLVGLADLMIGAGGTMTREAALLGTPAYTIFNGRLPAVDRELVRLGLLHDLREGGLPLFSPRGARVASSIPPDRHEEILGVVISAIAEAAGERVGVVTRIPLHETT